MMIDRLPRVDNGLNRAIVRPTHKEGQRRGNALAPDTEE